MGKINLQFQHFAQTFLEPLEHVLEPHSKSAKQLLQIIINY